jgi:UDP:flavonoid glycosyltransferase YjiC (YdhE family)
VIQIVGSRGDVQPFVALGKVLKETYGHRIRLATHATFQKFVEDSGLEFFSIGGDPSELMAFMVKNPGLMPGMDALKSGEITKRRQGIEEIILGCWRSCIEAGNGLGPPIQPHKAGEAMDESFELPGNPNDKPFVADAIIANPPSFAHIHIAEKLGLPLHMMFTMPWSPTRAFPHPLANIQSSNTDVVMTNYVTYALVEMMTWQGLGDVINRFRTKVLNLEPLSLIWAPGMLSRLRIPTTYCWSPALIPKPNDWGSEIDIAGFYFLNLASSYTPEPELADFLAAGPPPVYIGFGSIVVDDPNHLTRLIFDAVSITGQRALVSKGWGGFGADSVGIPDGVFMLGNCPHDWLFKHVSCVVHHGGAGTSAAGINLGKPTVVVPFFGDQPFWGAMISRAGAGPDPIPYKKLTAENLAAAIQEALKPDTQARAQELGAKIREEKGADMGGKFFHDHLDVDQLRCALAPSRVAVWRIRRTKTRLSALAAAVLVQSGRLKYSDLKL